MKLYVCWGTFEVPVVRAHPCKVAHDALLAAGHEPEVVKAYSFGPVPEALQTAARKEVKRLTGQSWVPVLVTDDGEAIHESKAIVAWAATNPASSASPA
ncbi:glutathione S-transferase N-terminal domain-containing protein [Conexibacter woesei]|uniref:GST N-terminal domain-containing protein n=1 Tax=Conexibacter woesei (strain DSM 14684 / CCUG 47730 / CIP 108061 / JCM 11494 / NBRC 100937 / ID131577) TaxID=469383 RepID=D3FD20_CONWI|nr:glutathione S-transferase N-terminal domain-containing protein [Conexibacter woesei]ADB51532.1 hypothetical protein Cwoe_3113 [Conexibacter woesei DSM 14684]